MIPSARSLRLWPQFGSILPFDLNPRLSAVKPPIRNLFIRGSLEPGLDRARIGIIGSRSACSLASAWAESTARRLSHGRWVVVSGGARGIDAAAHRGALKAAGSTWWVSGTAVDKVYPAEHRQLLQGILAADGALISEVPPGGNTGRHMYFGFAIVSSRVWWMHLSWLLRMSVLARCRPLLMRSSRGPRSLFQRLVVFQRPRGSTA